MNPAVKSNGVPLVNTNGVPALCKTTGCCGEVGTVLCGACDGDVPANLRVALSGIDWEDQTLPSGYPCENCTGCSEIPDFNFIVPFQRDTGFTCVWWGAYDVEDLTSCVVQSVAVRIVISRQTLSGLIKGSGTANGNPLCDLSTTGFSVVWSESLAGLPDWTCETMEFDITANPTGPTPTPLCTNPTGGNVTIIGV